MELATTRVYDHWQGERITLPVVVDPGSGYAHSFHPANFIRSITRAGAGLSLLTFVV